MKAFIRPALLRGFCAAISVFALTYGAAAGDNLSFAVDPVTFTLIPPVRNATITLTNLSTDPLRLHVSIEAWTEREDGTMEMAPTTGAIVFPQLFTLPPSSSQRLRAAIVAPVSTNEQTFRIVVSDLPPLGQTIATPRGKANITLRTRFLVPVYVEPTTRTSAGRFENVQMHGGHLTFALVNSGTVHLEGLTLPIELRDANGATLLSNDVGRWNVFAGARLVFTVDTGKTKCVVGSNLTISPGKGNLPQQTLTLNACS